MNKYRIYYRDNNKTITILKGEYAQDVINQYGNRLVFGKYFLWDQLRIIQVDAKTNGKQWAAARCNNKIVIAEAI